MRRELRVMVLVGLAALAAQQAALAAQQAGAGGTDDVRVLFLTDCRPYSHWQAIGMAYSFKKSGQPGKRHPAARPPSCCRGRRWRAITPPPREACRP
jgi:hypothetical protein